MFVTGPKVAKTVTGEDITTENLGGATVHATKSGVAHFRADDEDEGIMLIRKTLEYLPQNNLEDPVQTECKDPIDRKDDILNEIIPEAVYVPEDETKNLWAIDYEKLIPVLTKAMQEQQEIITEMQKKYSDLEKQMEKQNNQMLEILGSIEK